MIKVITYGTFDLLHYGHIRLLERAKELGDYLIVGVTADDFDKIRGKINVQQSLMERVEAVRSTGIADEIIIEEYEGQKIDDIRKYDVDIFAIGSDWTGKFDYLNEYCRVIYLDRTQGISSSEMREQRMAVTLGLVGDAEFLNKIKEESNYVNGLRVEALCTNRLDLMSKGLKEVPFITDSYEDLIGHADAIYVRSIPEFHYAQIKQALEAGKHVLCESPITLDRAQSAELFELASKEGLILMEAIKTAYATAFSRMNLLIKSGQIGKVVSVDSTCTSLKKSDCAPSTDWNGMFEWGPTALLPIFQILGTEYDEYRIVSHFEDDACEKDIFSKVDFIYDHAVASIKVGDGVKSEGELIVSGTEGYIYVPAPWWKTDYFEMRFEDQSKNKRYFYQLDGEGVRYELVAFARAIERKKLLSNIDEKTSFAISDIMGAFSVKKQMTII